MTATRSPKIGLRECLVADYMRLGIVGCAPDTPLSEAAQQMCDHRIHCVVVGGLGESRRGTRPIWGVVSDLDLARAAAAEDEPTAGQVAATEPITASLSDSLAEVAHVMGEHDIAHLVVVDDRAQPIGVISSRAGAVEARPARPRGGQVAIACPFDPRRSGRLMSAAAPPPVETVAVDPSEQADMLLRDLHTDLHGLSQREADRRLVRFGRNELVRRGGRRWPRQLAQQFTHPLALLLAAAAVLAVVGGDRRPRRRHRRRHRPQRRAGLRPGAPGQRPRSRRSRTTSRPTPPSSATAASSSSRLPCWCQATSSLWRSAARSAACECSGSRGAAAPRASRFRRRARTPSATSASSASWRSSIPAARRRRRRVVLLRGRRADHRRHR